jgi:replication factor C subunit 3/5
MTFVERHRPQSVQDLVFADPIVAGIIDRYAHQQPTKPLLLYGAPGTGKSEALRLIAQTQFAQAGLEVGDYIINGGDAEKNVFTKMLNMGRLQMWPYQHAKLIVVDEIDEIEEKFPGQLRTFVEKFKHIQLLASTNYINKIKPALQSRMRCVEVVKPSNSDWVPRVHAILTAEGANMSPANVQAMLQNFTGDARDLIDYVEEQVAAGRQFLAPAGQAAPQPSRPSVAAVGSTP